MTCFSAITHRFTRVLGGLHGNTGLAVGFLPGNWRLYAVRCSSHEWTAALGPLRLNVFWWGFWAPPEIVVIADRIDVAQCAAIHEDMIRTMEGLPPTRH